MSSAQSAVKKGTRRRSAAATQERERRLQAAATARAAVVASASETAPATEPARTMWLLGMHRSYTALHQAFDATSRFSERTAERLLRRADDVVASLRDIGYDVAFLAVRPHCECRCKATGSHAHLAATPRGRHFLAHPVLADTYGGIFAHPGAVAAEVRELTGGAPPAAPLPPPPQAAPLPSTLQSAPLPPAPQAAAPQPFILFDDESDFDDDDDDDDDEEESTLRKTARMQR
jgi:hypothetical protein